MSSDSYYEYKLIIDFGGRDGISGIEHRELGKVSEEYARDHMALMLREHARRAELCRRTVNAWETISRCAVGGSAEEPK